MVHQIYKPSERTKQQSKNTTESLGEDSMVKSENYIDGNEVMFDGRNVLSERVNLANLCDGHTRISRLL